MNDLLMDLLKNACIAVIVITIFYGLYVYSRNHYEKIKAELPGEIATLNTIYYNNEAIASRDKMVAENFSFMATPHTLKGAAAMTGAEEFWSCLSPGDLLVEFAFSLSVEFGGKAKLVLIDPEGYVKVITENANQAQQTMTEKTLLLGKKGWYCIKLVCCDHPRFNLELRANKGRFLLD